LDDVLLLMLAMVSARVVGTQRIYRKCLNRLAVHQKKN
jgi:hypothetical protein